MPSSPRRSTVGLSCLSDRRFSGNLVGGLEGAFGEESVLGEENVGKKRSEESTDEMMKRRQTAGGIGKRRKVRDTPKADNLIVAEPPEITRGNGNEKCMERKTKEGRKLSWRRVYLKTTTPRLKE
eukprot:GHVS01026028.1.p4 GENE.GHVS01026028.1~~GHVS01026028.1.p4  ORF type:complete len:125 (-),score=32.65 GHVS01026028.1:836-1210(-)